MKLTRAILFAAMAGISAVANADIAYNDFGDGDSYDSSGYGIVPEQGVAMSFDSATSGAVSKIVVALRPNYLYNVSINLDDNGLPGQAMDSWAGVANTGQNAVTLLGDGSASLAAGSSYWVVVLADGDQAGYGEWFDENVTTKYAIQLGSDQWHAESGAAGAYRVETQVVPEPASAVALGIGVSAVAVRKRKRARK